MGRSDPAATYVIVGLGNPGRRYAYTRHNAGYRAVDALAHRWGIKLWRRRFFTAYGKKTLAGREVFLVQPHTYMNLSGNSVARWVDDLGLDLEHLLAICDDLNLPAGAIRLRPQGSAGGHKGLQSLIEELGGEKYPRLRVGIGTPPPGVDAADYVLAPMARADAEQMEQTVARAADAAESWLRRGVAATMAAFNQ
jgi:PTH1 family peptidyl-tRNA hydrolase